jgi:hypothetical protein
MPKPKKLRDPLTRILNRTTEVDGCWVFTGALRNGYGAVGIDYRTVYTHRYVYERMVGPIPDGLVIDHLCRNRACCNPAHLEPVTNRENCLRGDRAGTRVTACAHGHAYTPENTYTNPQGYRACRTCIKARRAAA